MTYRPTRMKFGNFMAPFHNIGENPTLTIERDMQLVEHLDALDYDEAWIGEHHSAGYETIGSPELFIAGVAPRTKRIRLGTGVNSLTYHNPLILADRMCQLDHQTRGRIMFGVGPGQLPSDAFMQGIHPKDQREMMVQSLDAMIELLEGKIVTKDAGWFNLVNARLQILPYQAPRMPMAVACALTPSGPLAAGRHGIGMLSVAASSNAGFAALPDHWRICEETAAKHGKTVHRDNWRIVLPIHVAETREEAFRQLSAGAFENITHYLRVTGGKPHRDMLEGVNNGEDTVKLWSTSGIGAFGLMTYGTPDDIAERIEQLLEQTGGFGRLLLFAHNAASWEDTKRSYELFARKVMPRFQHSDRRAQSMEWVGENAEDFIGAVFKGIVETVEKHKDLIKG